MADTPNMIAFIQFCMSKLAHRENLWESERLQAWHDRQNIVHRFANGVSVEIQLKPTPKKP